MNTEMILEPPGDPAGGLLLKRGDVPVGHFGSAGSTTLAILPFRPARRMLQGPERKGVLPNMNLTFGIPFRSRDTRS